MLPSLVLKRFCSRLTADRWVTSVAHCRTIQQTHAYTLCRVIPCVNVFVCSRYPSLCNSPSACLLVYVYLVPYSMRNHFKKLTIYPSSNSWYRLCLKEPFKWLIMSISLKCSFNNSECTSKISQTARDRVTWCQIQRFLLNKMSNSTVKMER